MTYIKQFQNKLNDLLFALEKKEKDNISTQSLAIKVDTFRKQALKYITREADIDTLKNILEDILLEKREVLNVFFPLADGVPEYLSYDVIVPSKEEKSYKKLFKSTIRNIHLNAIYDRYAEKSEIVLDKANTLIYEYDLDINKRGVEMAIERSTVPIHLKIKALFLWKNLIDKKENTPSYIQLRQVIYNIKTPKLVVVLLSLEKSFNAFNIIIEKPDAIEATFNDELTRTEIKEQINKILYDCAKEDLDKLENIEIKILRNTLRLSLRKIWKGKILQGSIKKVKKWTEDAELPDLFKEIVSKEADYYTRYGIEKKDFGNLNNYPLKAAQKLQRARSANG